MEHSCNKCNSLILWTGDYSVYCRNLNFETENLPSNSVTAHYESQILMLTNGRLQIHLGHLGVV